MKFTCKTHDIWGKETQKAGGPGGHRSMVGSRGHFNTSHGKAHREKSLLLIFILVGTCICVKHSSIINLTMISQKLCA